MRKTMKLMIIILVAIALLVALAIGAFARLASEKEKNYYTATQISAALEKKYTAMGDERVTYKEYDAEDEIIKKYAVWYPEALATSGKKYPVVIFANGTGSRSQHLKNFLTHLSSWGFIAVGNDDENTRTGESLNKTIEFLIAENNNPDSIFYQKIDLDNIGIGGHSQGGVAVYNMATNQPHAHLIKTVYAVSATSSYHSNVMKDGWQYDVSKINVPTFITAGTGFFDAGNAFSKDDIPNETNKLAQGITPLWSLQENFDALPQSIDKVIARKKNVDHGDSHLQFSGYMTAWFRYYLMNDQEAGEAFFGASPELSNGPNYQDVQIHQGE